MRNDPVKRDKYESGAEPVAACCLESDRRGTTRERTVPGADHCSGPKRAAVSRRIDLPAAPEDHNP